MLLFHSFASVCNQGLLLLSPFSSTNSYGTYSPVRYGVGHLSLFARIAKYPTQYHLGVVELQMTNTSSGRDIVYTSSVNSQPLDGSGLTFIPYEFFQQQNQTRQQLSRPRHCGSPIVAVSHIIIGCPMTDLSSSTSTAIVSLLHTFCSLNSPLFSHPLFAMCIM